MTYVLSVVFFWGMLHTRMDTIVTILPPNALILLWMLPSLSQFFFPTMKSISPLQGEIQSEEQNWIGLNNLETSAKQKRRGNEEDRSAVFFGPSIVRENEHGEEAKNENEELPITLHYQKINLLRIFLR